MRPRAIPVLLVEDRYLVKTRQFKKPSYVGDPINSVKIFNEKRADELAVLDILASQPGHGIDFEFVEQAVSEAFMPVAYGGGIATLADATRLFALGVEKVVINTALVSRPALVAELAATFGAQAVVAAVDVAERFRGRQFVAYDRARRQATPLAPAQWAREMEQRGAGEILLTSVRREGTRSGFDLDLIRAVSQAVSVPVIAHGGAGSVGDLRLATRAGASAAAAGSLFVHHDDRRAVLITYPTDRELTRLMDED